MNAPSVEAKTFSSCRISALARVVRRPPASRIAASARRSRSSRSASGTAKGSIPMAVRYAARAGAAWSARMPRSFEKVTRRRPGRPSGNDGSSARGSRASPSVPAGAHLAVVGCFAGHHDVVRMRLPQARTGDAHETRGRAKRLDVLRADVSHPRAQAAAELVHQLGHWPLVGDARLDPLREALDALTRAT